LPESLHSKLTAEEIIVPFERTVAKIYQLAAEVRLDNRGKPIKDADGKYIADLVPVYLPNQKEIDSLISYWTNHSRIDFLSVDNETRSASTIIKFNERVEVIFIDVEKEDFYDLMMSDVTCKSDGELTIDD